MAQEWDAAAVPANSQVLEQFCLRLTVVSSQFLPSQLVGLLHCKSFLTLSGKSTCKLLIRQITQALISTQVSFHVLNTDNVLFSLQLCRLRNAEPSEIADR